ncbi:MAG: hypothetical protein K2N33_04730 [Clostridia bacterium]|nr:hypothetical protein [Clostridia bacterium]
MNRRTQKRVRRFEFAICKLKCYNFSKGKRLKLLGCVPAVVVVRSMLVTYLG